MELTTGPRFESWWAHHPNQRFSFPCDRLLFSGDTYLALRVGGQAARSNPVLGEAVLDTSPRTA